jgi:hypothetical protein
MAAGLLIRNDSSEIVFSSDAYTYCYVGTATFVSTVPSPTTIPGGTYTLNAGYSTYTITWPGNDIIVAIPIPTAANNAASVVSKTKSGSTWTIKVQAGNGTAPNAAGFLTETSTTVHVWGIPTTDPGFGLCIYAPDGSLRADLSKRPLLIKEFVTLASGSATGTIAASYTTPGIITSAIRHRSVTTGSGLARTVSERYGRWWRSGTTLTRSVEQEYRYYPEDTDVTFSGLPAMTAMLVELNGL